MAMTQKEGAVLRGGILIYWSAFWVFNVIDKVLGQPIPLFAGKDRAAQLADYFNSVGITNSFVLQGTLVVITVLEVIAAYYLVRATLKFFKGDLHNAHHCFFRGTLVGLFIFAVFSIGDQVFGDRFELLEHTLYWIAILVSWAAYTYFPRRKRA